MYRYKQMCKLPVPIVIEVTFVVSSQAATCYYQSNPRIFKNNRSKVEVVPISALPRKQLFLLAYLHTIPLMLNVKQGSCEYYILKSFGLTRRGNLSFWRGNLYPNADTKLNLNWTFENLDTFFIAGSHCCFYCLLLLQFFCYILIYVLSLLFQYFISHLLCSPPFLNPWLRVYTSALAFSSSFKLSLQPHCSVRLRAYQQRFWDWQSAAIVRSFW